MTTRGISSASHMPHGRVVDVKQNETEEVSIYNVKETPINNNSDKSNRRNDYKSSELRDLFEILEKEFGITDITERNKIIRNCLGLAFNNDYSYGEGCTQKDVKDVIKLIKKLLKENNNKPDANILEFAGICFKYNLETSYNSVSRENIIKAVKYLESKQQNNEKIRKNTILKYAHVLEFGWDNIEDFEQNREQYKQKIKKYKHHLKKLYNDIKSQAESTMPHKTKEEHEAMQNYINTEFDRHISVLIFDAHNKIDYSIIIKAATSVKDDLSVQMYKTAVDEIQADCETEEEANQAVEEFANGIVNEQCSTDSENFNTVLTLAAIQDASKEVINDNLNRTGERAANGDKKAEEQNAVISVGIYNNRNYTHEEAASTVAESDSNIYEKNTDAYKRIQRKRSEIINHSDLKEEDKTAITAFFNKITNGNYDLILKDFDIDSSKLNPPADATSFEKTAQDDIGLKTTTTTENVQALQSSANSTMQTIIEQSPEIQSESFVIESANNVETGEFSINSENWKSIGREFFNKIPSYTELNVEMASFGLKNKFLDFKKLLNNYSDLQKYVVNFIIKPKLEPLSDVQQAYNINLMSSNQEKVDLAENIGMSKEAMEKFLKLDVYVEKRVENKKDVA